MKVGLKLWSTNQQYIKPALDLYEKELFHYIELFVEPHSESFLILWKPLRIPFVLHAPTAYTGLNFSDSRLFETNLSLISTVDAYYRSLNPAFIIFHPGISGEIDETIRQLIAVKQRYPQLFHVGLIENKPKIGLKKEKCIGYSPQQIDRLMSEAGMGFCLDFGHAICAAAAEGCFWKDYVNSFIDLHPKMFHLSDGHVGSILDEHLHFGSGDFDITWILSMLSDNDIVSLETKKDNVNDLNDFNRDVNAIKRIFL